MLQSIRSVRSVMSEEFWFQWRKFTTTLIFATHYPELLDEYDRNDSIEKCFFAEEQLSKEEALQTVGFLLGSVEKEAHKK